jgi:DNA gyrase inhibitor GyrI
LPANEKLIYRKKQGELQMSEKNVRIVKLEPMQVASFLGFGPSPEEVAFEKLNAWAGPKGILKDRENHRIFGFNNPNPSAGSPNYGYEVWIVIDPDEVEPAEDVEVKEFPGGLYAVSECVVPKGFFDAIGEGWKELVAWREDSKYRGGSHQWLEEHLPVSPPDAEFVLDLYLPIVE